jgi:photosystem II stability/assembly factor-like uncharacterized protein
VLQPPLPRTPTSERAALLGRCLFGCAALWLLPVCGSGAPGRTPETEALLLDVCRVGGQLYACGERGRVLLSDTSGATWQLLSTPTHATLTSIYFADFQRGWAVGHDGTIIATNDGSMTWSIQSKDINPEFSFLDVAALDARTAVVSGAFGAFFYTIDGGRSWTQRKLLDEDLHLNRIQRGPNGTLLIAGERGTLLKLPDLKKAPEVLRTGYEGSFNGLHLTPTGALLAYGLRGTVYRSEDGGASWTHVEGLPTVSLSCGLNHSSGSIILAGQARAFLISTDDGRTFAPLPAPITWAVADLAEAPDGSIVVVGEAGAGRFTLSSAPPPPAP